MIFGFSKIIGEGPIFWTTFDRVKLELVYLTKATKSYCRG